MVNRLWRGGVLAGVLLGALVWANGREMDGRRWWSYIEFLADDKLEGRDTGSEGHRKAAAFVAGEFERAGLKPAGTDGYIQPVRFDTRRIVEKGCSLALVRGDVSQPLVLGEDAMISPRVQPTETLDAGLVFAGYGLTVPELKYDDLAGLDLRGKVMVMISGGPATIAGPLRAHYQSGDERGPFLERAGVVGVITILNPHSMDIPWPRLALSRFQTAMSLADASLSHHYGQKLSVLMNPERAGTLFEGSGHTFKELVDLVDEGKPLPTFPLNASIRARTETENGHGESQNVAAILPGSDPVLKNEYVVLSSHLDHIGVGEPINGDKINNGAMDDASGVATLLDIAHTLHDSKAVTKRSLLFITVTGEEKGLLGSKYFAAHPTVAAKNVVADLNIDMFLPLYTLRSVTVYGLNESDLGDMVKKVAGDMNIRVLDDPEPRRNVFIRSDQYSFIRRGVPALAFKFGFDKGSEEERIVKKWLTERYHAPSDDLQQPVDIPSAGRFNQLLMNLAEAVANQPERPHWKADSFFRRFAD